ncbi:phosphoribosyl-AMP cyclohydrolase [Dictyobacter arantiisoli]|uniref:Histidine biosynthesis bifunctional protein HisIE n=1 Tax=Dictyobacter arantiisoli TaxID=2014874 RepID=A0A5A5TEQ1_9CHLR|nr:phosphoribosyl-AMP cyclohydrolase [Dictyobacter arantiisoli]GCF09489.1 hypothetical protein KDI_30530 [Dictyobacter arantiisoli]
MLNFDSQGLVPAVIVDDATNEVLMVAFMNQESLQLTRETGQTHFFSRSRNKIWHKGEQSGNVQDVRAIFVNCEENSLLIRIFQHGDAACHEGYQSCYYRQLLPDDRLEIVAERVFDPEDIYQTEKEEVPLSSNEDDAAVQTPLQLEQSLRQLYAVYASLRDQDRTAISNTSRLLHEKNQTFLEGRLADELSELIGVQTGEHIHTNLPEDTALEGSQVGYWLFLLAAINDLTYEQFNPHTALLQGFAGQYTTEKAVELREQCVQAVTTHNTAQLIHGLTTGFSIVGWACISAGISPLAPIEYDLEQMRRKGLVD